jgi:predicted negative regulator of RcsB-dependent stress response
MKRLAIVIAVLVSAALPFLACTSDRSEPAPNPTKLAEPSDAIDQELMVALGQAKNFHHKAKLFMADGKTDDAIAAVRQILSLPFPKGAPEAEDVRNDARAMLAKLLVGKAELAAALQIVDEGIAQSQRESFFVANLHTVKGEILEAQGQAANAIMEYDRSIKINEALQKRLMEQRQ